MDKLVERTNWSSFLNSYSVRNVGRPTRLGVFEMRSGVADDLWLEDGLALVGVDFDSKSTIPRIEIMFEKFTHAVAEPDSVRFVDGGNSPDEGLEITDKYGATTVLRFEDGSVRS